MPRYKEGEEGGSGWPREFALGKIVFDWMYGGNLGLLAYLCNRWTKA